MDQLLLKSEEVAECLNIGRSKVYTHVDPELNRAATDLMEEALWPTD